MARLPPYDPTDEYSFVILSAKKAPRAENLICLGSCSASEFRADPEVRRIYDLVDLLISGTTLESVGILNGTDIIDGSHPDQIDFIRSQIDRDTAYVVIRDGRHTLFSRQYDLTNEDYLTLLAEFTANRFALYSDALKNRQAKLNVANKAS